MNFELGVAPQAKLLFVSLESSASIVREAFRLGAHGYVDKLRAKTDLLLAIDVVLAGRRFVSSGLESAENADAAEAAVALSKPITNGLTYNFTFDFEKAGETTMTVPISAGEAPRREAAVEAGDTGGHH